MKKHSRNQSLITRKVCGQWRKERERLASSPVQGPAENVLRTPYSRPHPARDGSGPQVSGWHSLHRATAREKRPVVALLPSDHTARTSSCSRSPHIRGRDRDSMPCKCVCSDPERTHCDQIWSDPQLIKEGVTSHVLMVHFYTRTHSLFKASWKTEKAGPGDTHGQWLPGHSSLDTRPL